MGGGRRGGGRGGRSGFVSKYGSAFGRHRYGAALAVGAPECDCLVVDGDDAPLHSLSEIDVSVHVDLAQARHVVADNGTHTKERGDGIDTHLSVREGNVQWHVCCLILRLIFFCRTRRASPCIGVRSIRTTQTHSRVARDRASPRASTSSRGCRCRLYATFSSNVPPHPFAPIVDRMGRAPP